MSIPPPDADHTEQSVFHGQLQKTVVGPVVGPSVWRASRAAPAASARRATHYSDRVVVTSARWACFVSHCFFSCCVGLLRPDSRWRSGPPLVVIFQWVKVFSLIFAETAVKIYYRPFLTLIPRFLDLALESSPSAKTSSSSQRLTMISASSTLTGNAAAIFCGA